MNSRMNEASQVKRYLFSKIVFLLKDDKHVTDSRFMLNSGKYQGLFGLAKIQTMARLTFPDICLN